MEIEEDFVEDDVDVIFHPSQFDVPFEEESEDDEISILVRQYASNIMNFVLMMNLAGENGSCTTTKIIEKCFNGLNVTSRSKSFRKAIKKARTDLQFLFGFDLINDSYVKVIDRKLNMKSKVKKEGITAKDRWYVFNKSDDDSEKRQVAEAQEPIFNEERGILMLFIGEIVLESFQITEHKLRTVVQDFDIGSENETYNFDELLKKFISQGYLQRRALEKKNSMGKREYEILLAKRTYLEIGLPNIWAFLGKTCNDITLSKAEKRTLTGAITT